jgi:hypothetical protein
MDRAQAVTATIIPTLSDYALTIVTTGNASGTVTFIPTRPICTVSSGATCTREFAAGTVVDVRAFHSSTVSGSVTLSGCQLIAQGGLDATCRLTMDGPKQVTVEFRRPSTVVTLLGAGTGSGTVASQPFGIACTVTSGQTSGTCFSDLFGSQTVVLSATPAAGSTFAGFTGCPRVVGSTCEVGALASATVTAMFNTSAPPPEPSPSPSRIE